MCPFIRNRRNNSNSLLLFGTLALQNFVFEVREVIPSAEDPGLSFIAGGEYAEVKVPYLFNGSDTSNFASSLSDLGIDEGSLRLRPMRDRSGHMSWGEGGITIDHEATS